MDFFKAIKDKYNNKRKDEIKKWSEKIVTVNDFAGNLYITFNGTPLVPIEDNWTSEDILKELSKIRCNYIVSKQVEFGLS